MSRRILILYTGGTIGMLPSAEGYVPMPGFHDRLLQQLDSRATAQLPDYDLLEFDDLIDSANLVPDDWRRIGRCLAKHWQRYDGFVILHGTDTLAYTASALSFMLQQLDKPVILTGSQIPLAELRNDALDNLITALLLAGNRPIPEVCVLFNGRLLRGNRSRKVRSDGLDAFDSPNFPWLGRVGIDIELQTSLLLPAGEPKLEAPVFDPNAVALLPVYPGIPARTLAGILDHSAIRGLILQTYGVGNPPDANRELMDTLAQACDRGIAVLNITQCDRGAVIQGAYATGAALNRIGVVAGRDITPEAAFAKLQVLIARGYEGEALRQALDSSLCGECTT
ncbi:L-asparaginase 1 [Marinobacterium nitratireducens]|uniref:asparaginase n=1 Tax=Marinobacterium nitratireducens TaxID=518897 RepID=A0A917ZPJ9_9GAMM|nr:asparaginase [Marinobacterium nitratireducens]GGO86976.1 L-asparaginase 1 [Marinobacterium nitratireducens]